MASRQSQKVEELVEAVHAAKRAPESEPSQKLFAKALGHAHFYPVSEAARLVGELELAGYEAALRGVWQRFLHNAAKTDPGCRAKEAALTALDRLTTLDPEPFVAAVRYVQYEPVFGGRADTASGTRLRALSALFRLCHPDAPLYAGELLADPDVQVRLGTVQALRHYGDRTVASLLAYKLRARDPEPEVVSEAAAALLTVCPDFALPLFRGWLRDGSDLEREAAALALGQSGSDDTVGALIEWLDEGSWDRDVALGLRALALGRSARAREYLLSAVEHGSKARALSALEVLSIHSYDAGLVSRVREAVQKNPAAGLSTSMNKLFGSRPREQ
jgi:hypothetical protein